MARRQNTRFTIYDAMEARGVFDENPANQTADQLRDGVPFSTWPNRFPKMLYHPKGEERVTRQAEIIMTPMGPQRVNEQRELVSAIVQNEAELKALAEKGWHDHPRKAVAARLGKPIANPQEEMLLMRQEIARLQANLADANAKLLNPSVPVQQSTGVMTAATALAESAKLDLSEAEADEEAA